MLSEEQNRTVDAGRPRHADGRAAASLLDAHRRRRRAGRHADEAGAAHGRGPRALPGPGAAPTASSTGTARIAAPTCPTASSRTAGCAATITAGCATRRPVPGSSRSRRRRIRRRGSRTACGSRPIRSRPRPASLWAYLGPAPAPLVPTWEPFTWDNGFVQIVFAEIPCNWFQCQENSIDPVHFEWLHGNWSRALEGDRGRQPPTAPQDRLRRVRVRLRLPARARGPVGRRTSCGRSAASACGRTACSPAATSSGACPSTTTTR